MLMAINVRQIIIDEELRFKGAFMASFCENCPDKSSCAGPIESLSVASCVTRGSISEGGQSASFSFENGVAQGPTDMTVRYRDAEGGNSEPITMQGHSGSDAENKAFEYVGKIERCTGPTEVKRFFGLVTRRECSAPQA
jgi:hypothetical protein